MSQDLTPQAITEVAIPMEPEVMNFLLGQMDAWWDTLSPAQKLGLWVKYGKEPS